jgi:hypothetical protein
MDGDLLDRRLVDHPLFYGWSADSQKLYYWLRRQVCRGEAGASAEALAWHARGYLCVATTGGVLMQQAAPVSKNTLTKLMAELRRTGVAHTHTTGRGLVFLLGEWWLQPSRWDGRPLYAESFYLDALLRGQAVRPPAAHDAQ